jgi:hypothetical protein
MWKRLSHSNGTWGFLLWLQITIIGGVRNNATRALWWDSAWRRRSCSETSKYGWSFSVRFGFYQKKVIKTIFLKSKPVPTDWFRFGYFGEKPVQTSLALFFPVQLGFFPVRSVFFGFRLIKPKLNQSVFSKF